MSTYEYAYEIARTTTSVDVAVIVAIISGVVAIIGIIANNIVTYRIKKAEAKNREKAEARARMRDPYEKLVGLIYKVLRQTKLGEKMDHAELSKTMEEINKSIILNSSNKVLVKWGEFRIGSANQKDAKQVLHLKAELLRAIREDLGVEGNSPITNLDILKLSINDPENLT